jgi:hypothetical protein
MDNVLQTALAEAVNSLASFFGTTTEAVMEHAPEFLAKYGWYSTLNSMSYYFFFTILITSLLCLIVFMVLMVSDTELKHPIKAVIGVIIVIFAINFGTKIITCMVAPEIVGAHAILDLLKSVK